MNLTLLRSFFTIVEHGSLSQAAERLHVSQSTLSRQLLALEQEIGGALLERGPGGVTLSATGHALFDGMQPVLASFDTVLGEVRRRARGQSEELRIGYLLSAASDYLNPALVALRKAHPEVKVRMLDLSPGEQIAALRKGDIDVGLIGQESGLQSKEFYVRTLAVLPVMVAMPADHKLAAAESVNLGELRQDVFVGAHDGDLPGPPLDHVRHRRGQRVGRSQQIDLDQPAHHRRIESLSRRRRMRAGIRHHEVDRAEIAHDLDGDIGGRAGVGDVQRIDLDGAAAFGFERSQVLGTTGGSGDAPAVARESQGQRPADAGRGPGDPGELAGHRATVTTGRDFGT